MNIAAGLPPCTMPAGATAVSDVPPGQLQWSGAMVCVLGWVACLAVILLACILSRC